MVVVHDWPKHPFNLPFAKTLLIQHQPAPNFKIQAEKILATWRAMLRAMADPDKPNSTKPAKPASAWEKAFDLQLDRAPDGTWFLHAGPLVLIAIGLDDNFLVLSYSIPAAQMNLQHLKTAFRVPNTQSVSKGGT